MGGWVVDDGGMGWASLFLHRKESVDPSADWEVCRRLGAEVGYQISPNRYLMVVQDEEDLSGVLELLYGGVHRKEVITNKEKQIQGVSRIGMCRYAQCTWCTHRT